VILTFPKSLILAALLCPVLLYGYADNDNAGTPIGTGPNSAPRWIEFGFEDGQPGPGGNDRWESGFGPLSGGGTEATSFATHNYDFGASSNGQGNGAFTFDLFNDVAGNSDLMFTPVGGGSPDLRISFTQTDPFGFFDPANHSATYSEADFVDDVASLHWHYNASGTGRITLRTEIESIKKFADSVYENRANFAAAGLSAASTPGEVAKTLLGYEYGSHMKVELLSPFDRNGYPGPATNLEIDINSAYTSTDFWEHTHVTTNGSGQAVGTWETAGTTLTPGNRAGFTSAPNGTWALLGTDGADNTQIWDYNDPAGPGFQSGSSPGQTPYAQGDGTATGWGGGDAGYNTINTDANGNTFASLYGPGNPITEFEVFSYQTFMEVPRDNDRVWDPADVDFSDYLSDYGADSTQDFDYQTNESNATTSIQGFRIFVIPEPSRVLLLSGGLALCLLQRRRP